MANTTLSAVGNVLLLFLILGLVRHSPGPRRRRENPPLAFFYPSRFSCTEEHRRTEPSP